MKLLIVIFSIFFALISYELFLGYSPLKNYPSPMEYDDRLGMWHKKDFSSHIKSDCYNNKYYFDSMGRVKNFFPYEFKKHDVVLLGDSFIEALMVQNSNIIHNSLAKIFSNKYNFLNYGLSGSSPIQQLVILKDKVNLSRVKYVLQFINLESDLDDINGKNISYFSRPKVMINFNGFDNYSIIYPRNKNLYDYMLDLFSNLQLYQFIKKLLHVIINDIKKLIFLYNDNISKVSKNKYFDINKSLLHLQAAIFHTNFLIKNINSQVKYITIVNSNNIENKEIMKTFFNDYGIKVVWLDNYVSNHTLKLVGFSCDSHWNDKTHIDIANLIKNEKIIK
jgi:hypothetical protein